MKALISVFLLFLSSAGFAQDTLIIDAEFIGGEGALSAYITSQTKYPQTAMELNITGNVFIGFKILDDGKLTDFRFVKKSHPSIDYEAMRISKSMPAWKPATANGKNVSSEFVLPISFDFIDDENFPRLQENAESKRYHLALDNYNDGMVFFDLGEFIKAIGKFRNANDLWPNNYHFKLMEAKCFLVLNNRQAGCDLLNKAIEFIDTRKITKRDIEEVHREYELHCK